MIFAMTDGPRRMVTQQLLDVLEALYANSTREIHGYKVKQITGLNGPTVYKILERLVADGWATGRWEQKAERPNLPRRRYFLLTAVGRLAADELLAKHRPIKDQTPPTEGTE
jgi:DNA-binding PadR family transcriptional regulator